MALTREPPEWAYAALPEDLFGDGQAALSGPLPRALRPSVSQVGQ